MKSKCIFIPHLYFKVPISPTKPKERTTPRTLTPPSSTQRAATTTQTTKRNTTYNSGPASFLCWTANCGLLGWEVGGCGIQSGWIHTCAADETTMKVLPSLRTGCGMAEHRESSILDRFTIRHLPLGAGFVQFKHLLKILCLVLLLLKYPLLSGHPRASYRLANGPNPQFFLIRCFFWFKFQHISTF